MVYLGIGISMLVIKACGYIVDQIFGKKFKSNIIFLDFSVLIPVQATWLSKWCQEYVCITMIMIKYINEYWGIRKFIQKGFH